jgi:hypothetical protein
MSTSRTDAQVGVIYIMGAARSGSTIVGIALGNCIGGFFAGELDLYSRTAGLPTSSDPSRQSFWASVRQCIETSALTPRQEWHRWFEHPRGLATGGYLRRAELYRAFNTSLYKSISAQADAPVVVDSSHYPLRRWKLDGLPDVQMSTVYLVRDPCAVVRALQTDISPKHRAAAHAYVWTVHLLSELVFAVASGNKVRVRYEDFARDPARVVGAIAASSGLDASTVDYERLRTGQPFAGNRIIQREVVGVRPAGAVRPPRIGRIVQLPWRRRYGYGA